MGNFPSGQRDPHLGIHAVKTFVRDQDDSLRFYVDQLGFHVAFDARLQSGDRWVAAATLDGTAVLTLVAPQPESKEYQLIGRSTGVVLVTEDVTAKYTEWRRRGVRFHYAPRLRRVIYRPQAIPTEQQPPVWGGVFTRFRDVDDNIFELVGFDEFTREVESKRRANAEKMKPSAAPRRNWKLRNKCRQGCFRKCCRQSEHLNTRAFAFRPGRSAATTTTSSIWVRIASV